MMQKISKELSKRKIYHKVEGNLIKTRRSKVKIPKINKDLAYLIGVVEGDGSLSITKRKRGDIIIYLEYIPERKNISIIFKPYYINFF